MSKPHTSAVHPPALTNEEIERYVATYGTDTPTTIVHEILRRICSGKIKLTNS